jgi:hypothetical protein
MRRQLGASCNAVLGFGSLQQRPVGSRPVRFKFMGNLPIDDDLWALECIIADVT